MSTAFILILSLLIVPVILWIQYKKEQKLLESFIQCNELPLSESLNKFSISLIQIDLLPITGRFATTFLFSKDFNCSIYKDCILLTMNNEGKYYSRIIPKQDIKLKKDLFAGNIIYVRIDNVKLVFQVYSRDRFFK